MKALGLSAFQEELVDRFIVKGIGVGVQPWETSDNNGDKLSAFISIEILP
jgi:hypothetical protein